MWLSVPFKPADQILSIPHRHSAICLNHSHSQNDSQTLSICRPHTRHSPSAPSLLWRPDIFPSISRRLPSPSPVSQTPSLVPISPPQTVPLHCLPMTRPARDALNLHPTLSSGLRTSVGEATRWSLERSGGQATSRDMCPVVAARSRDVRPLTTGWCQGHDSDQGHVSQYLCDR